MDYRGPAVGQAEVVRRMSGSMARGAAIVGLATALVCAAVATVLAGVPGLYGATLGGVIGTVSALLTPLLMSRTTRLEPSAVMLASFGGMAAKAIVVMAALFTLGGVPGLHRMSLAVTLLVVVVTTTAAEAYAGSRLKIVIGAEPDSSDA